MHQVYCKLIAAFICIFALRVPVVSPRTVANPLLISDGITITELKFVQSFGKINIFDQTKKVPRKGLPPDCVDLRNGEVHFVERTTRSKLEVVRQQNRTTMFRSHVPIIRSVGHCRSLWNKLKSGPNANDLRGSSSSVMKFEVASEGCDVSWPNAKGWKMSVLHNPGTFNVNQGLGIHGRGVRTLFSSPQRAEKNYGLDSENDELADRDRNEPKGVLDDWIWSDLMRWLNWAGSACIFAGIGTWLFILGGRKGFGGLLFLGAAALCALLGANSVVYGSAFIWHW
jgi:hypothetical protein